MISYRANSNSQRKIVKLTNTLNLNFSVRTGGDVGKIHIFNQMSIMHKR